MRLKRARSSLKKSKLLTDERPVEAKNRRSLYNNRLISVFKDEPTGHVCIVRSVGGIGDVLMITPAIRQIKERYPLCKVTLALDRHRTRGDIYYELLKNAEGDPYQVFPRPPVLPPSVSRHRVDPRAAVRY